MTRIVLTSLATFLVLSAVARSQDLDTVTYFDHTAKKNIELKGKITEESPIKLVVKVAGSNRDIPVADLRDIEYFVGAGSKPTYRNAVNKEAEMEKIDVNIDPKKAFEESLEAYKSLQMEIKDKDLPFAKRHIQFSIGRLLAPRAESDSTQVEPAVQALEKFLKDAPESWQVNRAGKLLGQLQEVAGNNVGATKVYEDLVANTALPKEVRQEFEFLLARSLIQGGKHALARDRLNRIAKAVSQNDPQGQRVQVYLAECQTAAQKYDEAETELKKILNGPAAPAVKGMAANALGDCFLGSGKPEEAFWQYLWVDQLFNEDKTEHARALYHLSKLFDEVKHDAARAEACKELLLKGKEFSGLEFQKKLAREVTAKGMK